MQDFISRQHDEISKKYPDMMHKGAAHGNIDSAKKMLKFLDMVPEKYKVGPWSPVAHLVILSYSCFVMLTFSMALRNHTDQDYLHPASDWIQMYRLVGGLYGLSITFGTYWFVGVWPFASYTLTSWNFMSLRLLTAYLAGIGIAGMSNVADFLRYPALVGCSVTVTVWWIILVPLIDYLLSLDEGDAGSRKFFRQWNSSPMLLNVHLANLPLCCIEFLYTGVPLSFFDLWVALFVALLYCIFYLNVLDARGLHFYIIFTPRTPWCFISYVVIISAYYGFYAWWNYALQLVN